MSSAGNVKSTLNNVHKAFFRSVGGVVVCACHLRFAATAAAVGLFYQPCVYTLSSDVRVRLRVCESIVDRKFKTKKYKK